jgi:hypothetical protein
MANLVVYDDASTPVVRTYVPITDTPYPRWGEMDAAKPAAAQERVTMETDKRANGIMRRVVKLEIPVMEATSGGAADGYVAPPKVAHTIVAQVSLFAHERATLSQLANAIKQLHGLMIGDVAAGTGSAYFNATDASRGMLIKGILPN